MKQHRRVEARRCGEAMLKTTVSALVPCEEGPPQSHTRGPVVVLSTIYCRPIRDGPMRSRQPRGDLCRDVEREAA